MENLQDLYPQRLKLVAKNVFGSLKLMDMAFDKKQGYFSSYISKNIFISVDVLVTLLTKYNININWLLCGIGEMYVKTADENLEIKDSKNVEVPVITNEALNEILKRLNKLEEKELV